MMRNDVLRASTCCVALVGLMTVGGCTSSSSNSGDSPASTPASTSAPSSTQSSVAFPHRADKATTAAVRHAYVTFFNYRTPQAKSQSLLQNGQAFTAQIAQNAKTAKVQKVSVTVSSVKLVSAHAATVTFTLSTGGSPVLPDTSGFAVLEGKTWKVAGQTFCALLGLNGSHPPVCSSAAATTIPS